MCRRLQLPDSLQQAPSCCRWLLPDLHLLQRLRPFYEWRPSRSLLLDVHPSLGCAIRYQLWTISWYRQIYRLSLVQLLLGCDERREWILWDQSIVVIVVLHINVCHTLVYLVPAYGISIDHCLVSGCSGYSIINSGSPDIKYYIGQLNHIIDGYYS